MSEETTTTVESPKKRRAIKKGMVIGLLLLLLIAVASGGWYLYYVESKTLRDIKKDPSKLQELNKDEVAQLVAKVRMLYELPGDEQPTVATVADAEALKKSEPFFAKAQNGDKVLIYAKAKKAILYRPSTNKIIEVAPINIGPAEGTGEASPSAQPTSTETSAVRGTVDLRNGTETAGLVASYETELKTKAPSVSVVARGNTVNTDYVRSVVVDVKGTRAADVASLAKTLGFTVGTLPAIEATPSGDFLIILGSDIAQ